MPRADKSPPIICISGIDGSGKSTLCSHLAEKFRERGLSPRVEWLRFNHGFSKPLLALCRLVGLTRYEHVGGIRVGYHNFHKSKIVAWLFILLQYLDAYRVLVLRVRRFTRGTNAALILDRYVYDILVDLIVDTRVNDLMHRHIGRAFMRLLPPHAKVILVQRSYEEVLRARPENTVDRNFDRRFLAYEALSHDPRIHVIKNDGTLDELLSHVDQILVQQ